jgi:hypothetical protein
MSQQGIGIKSIKRKDKMEIVATIGWTLLGFVVFALVIVLCFATMTGIIFWLDWTYNLVYDSGPQWKWVAKMTNSFCKAIEKIFWWLAVLYVVFIVLLGSFSAGKDIKEKIMSNKPAQVEQTTQTVVIQRQ